MKTYIGIKMIQASQANKDEQEGYNVIYPDGYASWSPKAVFEAAYLPLTVDNSLTQAEIQTIIAGVQVSTLDEKTALVKAELVTGFNIYESASCVDPANYDEMQGGTIAMEKVNSKIWFALGFVLQWAKYGLHQRLKIEKQEQNQN